MCYLLSVACPSRIHDHLDYLHLPFVLSSAVSPLRSLPRPSSSGFSLFPSFDHSILELDKRHCQQPAPPACAAWDHRLSCFFIPRINSQPSVHWDNPVRGARPGTGKTPGTGIFCPSSSPATNCLQIYKWGIDSLLVSGSSPIKLGFYQVFAHYSL